MRRFRDHLATIPTATMIKPIRDRIPSLAAMEARSVEELPSGKAWQYEPKWHSFRCLAWRDGRRIELIGKSGKSLARYFPEVVASLAKHPAKRFIVDGELAIPQGDALAFDSLQARLHPAQRRIDRLARETPAILIIFDMLQTPDGEDLTERRLCDLRKALAEFFKAMGSSDVLRLSPATTKRAEAEKWLGRVGGGALDGVVAKRLDERYRGGERIMLKIKCLRSADCVVGGFRYATAAAKAGERKRRLVGSLLLGQFGGTGKLDHVGFISGISDVERPALTRKVEALCGGSGFSGKSPGGPSRWSTERSSEWEPLKPKLVVEVLYDHVTGDRFRHGTRFLRWRPDKAPEQCTIHQLHPEARPGRLLKAIGR